MRPIHSLILTSFLFLFVLNPLLATGAQSDVSAKVEIDHAFATIGDEINLRVTVIHPPEINILEINPQNAFNDFEVKRSTEFSHKEKGQISEGKNYVLTNYMLGEYVIHPFAIQYQAADGTVKELKTNSLYITIQSVDKNKAPESDIRGVKGVRKIQSRFWLWSLMIALMLGAGAASWIYYQRQKRAQSKADSKRIPTPHEEAYHALSQLQHSDLLKRGLVKLYFLRMSEILRRYFERRYEIRALESTSYEVLEALKRLLPPEILETITDVLSFCDLVKFAKYNPLPVEILHQNAQAKLIVDKTKEESVSEVVEPVKES
ncbi:MAG: hypothetical protein HY588_02795 [Candidatus Omnitrophica bacterium]|nr:hypothetical protein [Candidatus Omnitrophota bacterium]